MSDPQLDRIEAKLDTILAALDLEPPPDTGLAAPMFTAVLNPDRTITCAWVAPDGAEAIELHEFLTDPLHTLKATLPITQNTRKSGVLAGGHQYSYGVRALGGGRTSAFSVVITLDVPVVGGPVDPPPPVTGGGPAVAPSDVLDLRLWTVMLPTGAQGSPDNDYRIGQSIPGVFYAEGTGADRCVVFSANAGGVHSPTSQFPRSEARQMRDMVGGKAAWSSSGTHSLECELAIDARGLAQHPRICGMQIHDALSDVCELQRHETKGLGLVHDDGNAWEPIDSGYVDGARFTAKIAVTAGRLTVAYNGTTVVDIPKIGTGWYWKTGCYLQTNVDKYGEAPDARGYVRLYRYTLTGGAS